MTLSPKDLTPCLQRSPRTLGDCFLDLSLAASALPPSLITTEMPSPARTATQRALASCPLPAVSSGHDRLEVRPPNHERPLVTMSNGMQAAPRKPDPEQRSTIKLSHCLDRCSHHVFVHQSSPMKLNGWSSGGKRTLHPLISLSHAFDTAP
jgi:hypothetical protein